MIHRVALFRCTLIFLIAFLLLLSSMGVNEPSDITARIETHQAPPLFLPFYWGRVYGEGYAYSLDFIVENEYFKEIMVAGISFEHSHGLWVLKTNEYGRIIWERVYGENIGYENVDIVHTSDGGCVVAADYKNGVIVLKIDSGGDIERHRSYFIEGEGLYPVRILPLDDGSYFLLLNARRGIYGVEHMVLVKLASNLEPLWSRSYDSGEEFEAAGMVNVSGEYLIAGTEYIGGKKYGMIIVVDTEGKVLWKREYTQKWGDMEIRDIEKVSWSKDSFVVGGAVKLREGDWDLWLSQMTVDGNVSWSVSYGTASNDFVQSVNNNYGGYYVLARTGDAPHSMWLLKFGYDRVYNVLTGVKQYTLTGGRVDSRFVGVLKWWYVASGVGIHGKSELCIYRIDFRERFMEEMYLPEGSEIRVGKAILKRTYFVPIEPQPVNFSLSITPVEMSIGSANLRTIIPEYEDTMIFGMPYPPWNLTAEVSENGVKLRWLYNPVNISTGLQSFYIYRGTEPGNMKLIGKIESPKGPEDVGTSIIEYNYTDRNVSEGKKYYYYVTAVSDVGEGLKSEMVVVEVPSPMNVKILYSVVVIGVVAVIVSFVYFRKRKR